MYGPVDAYWFTDQARKCRELAEAADPRTAPALLEMAAEFEARAIALDERDEPAEQR